MHPAALPRVNQDTHLHQHPLAVEWILQLLWQWLAPHQIWSHIASLGADATHHTFNSICGLPSLLCPREPLDFILGGILFRVSYPCQMDLKIT
jgi:hypothetical protein